MSHDRVVRYVGRQYNGDWSRYVKKWEKQLSRMRSIRARNSSAVIKKEGITLRGEALDVYIKKIDGRVQVTRCLAAANGVSSFQTAAGGKEGDKSGSVQSSKSNNWFFGKSGK